MTPSDVITIVSSVLRIPVEDMQSPILIDDSYKMRPSLEWTPQRLARGMCLHWIAVKCPLAPEYGVGKMLSMSPANVNGERDAFRERLRRNPELRKSSARIEDALREKAKGKVRV